MRFSFSFAGPKESFPKIECTFPCLSVLNSNFQAAISFTIATKSSPTVQVFGFGISPFGQSTLAIFPKFLIIHGVAIHTSKSTACFPVLISSIRSSPQITSAQSFLSSSFNPESLKTQILGFFPVPFGRVIVVLII